MKVLGLGELLWDVFDEARKPGGAPANVAFELNQLGLDSLIASRVGTDPLGDEMLDFLHHMEIDTSAIQLDTNRPTGTVTVELDATGTPSYIIHKNVAWDFLEYSETLKQQVPMLEALCFGTLAQRSEKTHAAVQQILDDAPTGCLKVYDVNLRQNFYSRELVAESLRKSDVAKMNDGEMTVIRRLFEFPETLTATDFAFKLCKEFGVGSVCITRAEKGCLLVSKSGETADVPGKNVRVADTVGSGDAFSAALIYTMLAGCELAVQAEFANEVGTLVAARSGGMPPLRPELEGLKAKYKV